eukprot:scaffold79077_cov51-Phaeocystis_antarctica.AAC.1
MARAWPGSVEPQRRFGFEDVHEVPINLPPPPTLRPAVAVWIMNRAGRFLVPRQPGRGMCITLSAKAEPRT